MPGSEYISLQKPAESQGGEDLPKRMPALHLQDTRSFIFFFFWEVLTIVVSEWQEWWRSMCTVTKKVTH